MLSAHRRISITTATLAVSALALTACGTADEPAAGTQPVVRISTAYALPDDRAYPEGIAVDPRTGDTYVGSYTNGAIYRDVKGAATAEVFLPAGADGRTTANGLKVDALGRLWVTDSTAGVSVYDIDTRTRLAGFDVPGTGARFVNDLAITPDGTAYLTDTLRSVIYKVTTDQVTAARGEKADLAVAFDLNASLEPHAADTFTLNGVVADPTGRYLLVVDMNGGDLYRVATAANSPDPIRKVVLNGGDLVHGDGLELTGTTLWAVQNTANTLTRWTLSDDYTNATQVQHLTDESLGLPTTLVRADNRTLVVSSQFDKGGPMGPGTPATPFKVVAVDGI